MCTGADGQVLRTQKKRGASSSSSVCVIKRCLDQSPLHYWWKRMALLAQLSSEHQTGGEKKRHLVLEPIGCRLSMRKRPGLNHFFFALFCCRSFFSSSIWFSRSSPGHFFLLPKEADRSILYCTSAPSCCCLLRAGAYTVCVRI